MRAKTPQEQLDEALQSVSTDTERRTVIERAILRGVRARGHEVADAESRELVRARAREFGLDGHGRAFKVYEGVAVAGAEAVRQTVNAVVVQLEAEPDPAGQELTPLETVRAKLRATGIYAM